METELVIFDLDGTLLNTIEDLGTACNHALAACGYPEVAMERYNLLVGRGIMNLFLGALPEGEKTEENALRMRTHFLDYYGKHNADKTKPYPGIPELLSGLSAGGVKLAVASNKYQEGTVQLVRRFFGDIQFCSILGQREGKPIKPDPEIVFEAMRDAGVSDRSAVVYVGDSNVDMETGLNAGVKTIGVLWGFRTREELAAYKPWLLAQTAEEISAAII